jgi:hypothetical protein
MISPILERALTWPQYFSEMAEIVKGSRFNINNKEKRNQQKHQTQFIQVCLLIHLCVLLQNTILKDTPL